MALARERLPLVAVVYLHEFAVSNYLWDIVGPSLTIVTDKIL
jgi:hypothetical protein